MLFRRAEEEGSNSCEFVEHDVRFKNKMEDSMQAIGKLNQLLDEIYSISQKMKSV